MYTKEKVTFVGIFIILSLILMLTSPNYSSAVPSRTEKILVQNDTGMTLRRTSTNLAHGVWCTSQLGTAISGVVVRNPAMPPTTIAPHATVGVCSESSGFLTGTEGFATYMVVRGSPAACNALLKLHWNNPYYGSNTYSAQELFHNNHLGFGFDEEVGGDDATVRYTFTALDRQCI
jgi:Aegerolysin